MLVASTVASKSMRILRDFNLGNRFSAWSGMENDKQGVDNKAGRGYDMV